MKSNITLTTFLSDSSLSLTESYLEDDDDDDDDYDDSEENFRPELLGLLDNPGVVRFNSLDYPIVDLEYSDENSIIVTEYSNNVDDITKYPECQHADDEKDSQL